MITKCNTNLQIIQGDTFCLSIKLENVDFDTIEKIIFSSATLGISKEFQRREDDYYLELSCGETCNLSKTVCCYDITAFFIGNKVKTVEYRGVISVLEKVNKTDIEVPIVVPEGYFKPEGTKEITENGEFDVREFEKVNVLVLESIPEGYIKPEGTLDITENGKHNVTIYEEVEVNVPIPDGYIVPSGKVEIRSTEEVNVTEYAKAQIVDENLKAENIAEGIEVLGITGTFKGGIDTSDGTATADDLLLGKTAYVKDQKVIGTIPTYDGTVSDDFTRELDEFISGTMKEYSNDKFTSLAGYAFCGKALEKISLPNVTTAGVCVFAQCSKLIEVNLSSLEKITAINAFQGCTALEYIYLPKLQSVPTQCFNGCSNLKTVVLDSVTTIAGFGFQSCIKLENLVIRQSETICTLGNAFYGFTFTGTIYLPDSKVEEYKAHTNWSAYADQIKPLSEIPQEILDELEGYDYGN